jgi:hypothetical protein
LVQPLFWSKGQNLQLPKQCSKSSKLAFKRHWELTLALISSLVK